MALATALLVGGAQAQGFDFESVTRLARERASQPYRPVSDKLPADLAKLNYDQVRDIRWRPDRALWRAEKLPYEAMFFHLGLYQKEPVLINEVTPQGVRHIPYSRADFDYGKNQLRPEAWMFSADAPRPPDGTAARPGAAAPASYPPANPGS